MGCTIGVQYALDDGESGGRGKRIGDTLKEYNVQSIPEVNGVDRLGSTGGSCPCTAAT
jgi:hypothetical protein